MSNAPGKPVSFSRPKVGYFSNRPRIPNNNGNIPFFSFFLFMFVIKIAKLHPDFLMLEIMFSVLASEQVTCSPTCHCSHCNIFANSFH